MEILKDFIKYLKDNMTKIDRIAHMIISNLLVVLFFSITKSILWGLLIALGIGLLKELVWDKLFKMGVFSKFDIVANLIGCAIGLISTLFVIIF